MQWAAVCPLCCSGRDKTSYANEPRLDDTFPQQSDQDSSQRPAFETRSAAMLNFRQQAPCAQCCQCAQPLHTLQR